MGLELTTAAILNYFSGIYTYMYNVYRSEIYRKIIATQHFRGLASRIFVD